MPALYRRAHALVFPSLYEGFGVPVLEAMAAGLPVASSRTSSLAEVVGDAALELDPRSAEQMGEAIDRVSRDEDVRRRLRAAGSRQAEKFSWDDSATAHADVYRRAAELAGYP